MDLSELKREKQKLERAISEMLDEFHRKYGVSVGIELKTYFEIGSPNNHVINITVFI